MPDPEAKACIVLMDECGKVKLTWKVEGGAMESSQSTAPLKWLNSDELTGPSLGKSPLLVHCLHNHTSQMAQEVKNQHAGGWWTLMTSSSSLECCGMLETGCAPTTQCSFHCFTPSTLSQKTF